MKTADIKAFLFDADGVVLIKNERFSLRYSRQFNVPIEKLLVFFENEFQACLVGRADLKEEIKKYLVAWSWPGTVEELLAFWFDGKRRIDPLIIDLVGKIRSRGYACYVATNNEKYRTKYLREDVGLGKVFDKVYSSSQIGYKKPDKEFYEFIVRDLHLDPREVLFLDNDSQNIEGAREVGLKTIFYNDSTQLPSLTNDSLT